MNSPFNLVNCRSDENDGSGAFVSSTATVRGKEMDSGPEGQHGGAGGDDLASAGTLKTALKEALTPSLRVMPILISSES